MDIRIRQERIAENEAKLVYIFNPTTKEFSLKYKDIFYTSLPSSELKLPYYGAELLVKKIVDYMVNRKKRVVAPEERKEMAKRIRLYEQNTVN